MAVKGIEQKNLPSSANAVQDIPSSNVSLQKTTEPNTNIAGGLSQELIDAIKQYIDDFKRSEEVPRAKILKICRKGELYWEGFQRLWWDETNQDYRTPEDLRNFQGFEDIDVDAYEKIVNIYKAHGESIIAAMSAEIPHVEFFPEDADLFDDILTAKSFSQVATVIQRHNQAPLLFIRALFLLFNQGLLCGYNYTKEDKKFGTNKTPIQGVNDVVIRQTYCPQCGTQLGEEQIPADYAASSNPPNEECPNCMEDVGPEFDDAPMQVPAIVGMDEKPKKREILELYGPTHIQIPHYVTTPDQIPILIFKSDQHRGLVADVFTGGDVEKLKEDRDSYKYDRWARLSNSYYGEMPDEVGTLEQIWIAPWVFNTFDEKVKAQLKAKFPDGAYCVFFNDEYIFSGPEDMHDHWTISVSPISSKIHAQPLGKPIQPIQDMTNETKNLILETIRYSIPETFADPKVLSFGRYKKTEIRPGMVIPATPRPGQSISEGFYTNKTASLSREVEPFASSLNEDAQFTSGAFPSIYGGTLEGGSGTLGEYNASRAQALQRLQITWKVARTFWASFMEKGVRDFVNNMDGDEKFVEKNGRNAYMNIWIRRRNLNGEVGRVEPQADEHFPTSWAQKRDILLSMIQFKHPAIDEVLFHPENRQVLASYLGFNELHIPGVDQRDIQLAEIAELVVVTEGPIIEASPMGGELLIPTIDINPGVDDDDVHIQTCIAWLVSPMGQDAKVSNPGGYMNVMAHKELHEFHQNRVAMVEQQKQAAAAGQQKQLPPGNEGGPGEVNEPNNQPARVA